MLKPAVELYNNLFKQAIDCNTVKGFKHWAGMTTAHAERRIIELLKPGKLYTYNGQFIVKHFNRLCVISLNKQNPAINVGTVSYYGAEPIPLVEEDRRTVRVSLPFSPKHICGGYYKGSEIKRISDASTLNHILMGLNV